MTQPPKPDRIAELKDELKQRDAPVKELRTDLVTRC